MKRRLFKTLVAVLAMAAAAAAGPAWGQTTYNVTFGGFAEPAVNTTVSVASLPQTFTQINNTYVFYPWKVISTTAENYTSASVTSGGNGQVSATIANSLLSITVSGTFEGTATIHVEGSYWDPNHDSPVPLSCDVTVACPEPPTPHTVRFVAGNDGWSVQDVTASASATAPAVLENVMAGDSLVVTAPASLPGKVKSVKAVKFVAVQSIVLNKQTASLAKDSTMTLSVASVLPENAADKSYSWSSDDIAVADVDQNGVVIGHNAGTANIIATANDGSGAKDTCVVTVLRSAILDGVRVLYASDYGLETWSTVVGYNPGVMYQDGGKVRLTSNGAFLYHDRHPLFVDDLFYPGINGYYQWLRVVEIGGIEFYYHQGETWQQAINAGRPDNNDWSIDGGQVKFMGYMTLIDTDSEPVAPTATIDPTVDYGYIMW